MAADAWREYDPFPEHLGSGVIILSSHSFKAILCSSTSNAGTVTLETYSQITNELATANGYTNGGQVMTAVTWNRSAAVTTWDSDNAVWTASGAGITARYSSIFDDTPAGTPTDPLCMFSLLDNTPADVTAAAGDPFTVAMAATGITAITAA